jgi:hypothetical protein
MMVGLQRIMELAVEVELAQLVLLLLQHLQALRVVVELAVQELHPKLQDLQ